MLVREGDLWRDGCKQYQEAVIPSSIVVIMEETVCYRREGLLCPDRNEVSS